MADYIDKLLIGYMLKKTYNTKFTKFGSFHSPSLLATPPILIIMIWSEQGSEPEVRVTKGGGILGHGCAAVTNDA